MLADTVGFILAGGRSSRMGTDKAFLRLGQMTLLEVAIHRAKQVCESVVLVGDRQRLSPFGIVVEDNFPGQGPLAGIEAALSSAQAQDLNLVLSVDTPQVPAEFLSYLLEQAHGTEAKMTVPRAAGHLQTLCAVYRRDFAAAAESALRAGRNKIDPLFALMPLRVIEEDELRAEGFSPAIFDNVNTPGDWERIQQRRGTKTT